MMTVQITSLSIIIPVILIHVCVGGGGDDIIVLWCFSGVLSNNSENCMVRYTESL